ncbi:pentapeptide repeat-containing protein [Frankia nepalensis]|uniref:pentapeptide repeat-containing protein n=1 Tax=Frankia nepalensis TaxID=1836974 RepID=UPI00288A7DBF|nr:pentapeptide repeat-containing protein [Frankia nepalensis]
MAICVAGTFAAATVVAVFLLPPVVYRSVDPTADHSDARAALQSGLLTAAAALVAVVGGLVALAETRRSNANTHVRELYTRAVDQLGSENITVRLGGIYALERIAKDSPDDQRTVVEVVSAFVREKARPSAPAPAGPATPAGPRRLEPDVQAALTILGRLPLRRGVHRADLTDADLTGAELSSANLAEARLHRTNLTGAQLNNLILTGSALLGANLTGARLAGADLTNALLVEANLTGARLDGADLTGAVLVEANLSRARLDGASLKRAVLFDADLTRASLFDANLTDATLNLANLTDARLNRTDLTGASLDATELGGADLVDARGLVPGQLDVASGNARTRLSTDFQRPASWPPAAS